MTKIVVLMIALGVAGASYGQTTPGDQAQKNGVRACQQTVENIAKFVVKENPHGSIATWNKTNPDSRMFGAQISVKYTDGNSVAVLSAAPTRAGTCDGYYTTIFTDEKSCSVMRETTFRDWKFYGESAGLIVLENESGSLSKILLPSGTGCVAITSEMVYS